MKTKTLSILFALVMVLSLSAGVFAQDFTQTWDEETVLTVFSDVDLMFSDLFADEDSNYLFNEEANTVPVLTPDKWMWEEDGEFAAKALELEDFEESEISEAKALTEPKADLEASYYPCGDGLVKFDMTIYKAADDPNDYNGPANYTYIREINATVDDEPVKVKKCSSSGNDNCRSVKFDKKGEAHITGYLAVPWVLDEGAKPKVEIKLDVSKYMTALWDVAIQTTVTGSVDEAEELDSYCQDSLELYALGGVMDKVRARYDENTGEARFQATIRNKEPKTTPNYVIPGEVYVVQGKDDDGNDILVRYTDYTCKYTVYNTVNTAPRTDYCKFGEGIALAPNSVIRFDLTIDHLTGANTGDLPFSFRVGGMKTLVDCADAEDTASDSDAKFEPVPYPCPPVTRMSVMDPIRPFMTFYAVDKDTDNDLPIEPSGAYGVYEGGLWGLYQKCGKYAYMAVRLKNDGVKTETVNIGSNHVAVAVNGGTPMSWQWILTTVPETDTDLIDLEPGEDVILFGKALVTNVPSQMNSDLAITGAVNFLDYGFYVTGKVYSDHNNTNCTVAP